MVLQFKADLSFLLAEVTFFYKLCDFCLAFKVYLCIFLLFWKERQEKTPQDCHFDAISLTDGHSLVRIGPGALIFSYKDSIRLDEEPL